MDGRRQVLTTRVGLRFVLIGIGKAKVMRLWMAGLGIDLRYWSIPPGAAGRPI